jgi:hypothetical protein
MSGRSLHGEQHARFRERKQREDETQNAAYEIISNESCDAMRFSAARS